jgi:hypothetical protein
MSALALRQLSPDAEPGRDGWREAAAVPAGYIDFAEARRRAGNSQHYTGQRSGAAVRQWLYRLARAAVDSDLAPTLVDGRLCVHPSLHLALSEPADSARLPRRIRELPAGRRNRALTKARVLAEFKGFRNSAEGRRLGKVEARRGFVERHRESYTYSDNGRTRIFATQRTVAPALGNPARAARHRRAGRGRPRRMAPRGAIAGSGSALPGAAERSAEVSHFRLLAVRRA